MIKQQWVKLKSHMPNKEKRDSHVKWLSTRNKVRHVEVKGDYVHYEFLEWVNES